MSVALHRHSLFGARIKNPSGVFVLPLGLALASRTMPARPPRVSKKAVPMKRRKHKSRFLARKLADHAVRVYNCEERDRHGEHETDAEE